MISKPKKGFGIEVSSILKLATLILGVDIAEALRDRSVWTSIIIFVYFDIEALFIEYCTIYRSTQWLWYRSLDTSISKCTETKYRTRYWSTSISKFTISKKNSGPSISKTHCRYSISMSSPQTSISKNFTRYRRYLKFVDVEDVTSISRVLLRYWSFVQGLSHSLSNESQHPVSCIHATDIFAFQEDISSTSRHY